MTSNAEDISSFLAVRKLQDSSRSFNKKIMLSLAALLAVATIAMIFYSCSGSASSLHKREIETESSPYNYIFGKLLPPKPKATAISMDFSSALYP